MTCTNRFRTAALVAVGLTLVLIQARCRRGSRMWRACERALEWVNEKGERL